MQFQEVYHSPKSHGITQGNCGILDFGINIFDPKRYFYNISKQADIVDSSFPYEFIELICGGKEAFEKNTYPLVDQRLYSISDLSNTYLKEHHFPLGVSVLTGIDINHDPFISLKLKVVYQDPQNSENSTEELSLSTFYQSLDESGSVSWGHTTPQDYNGNLNHIFPKNQRLAINDGKIEENITLAENLISILNGDQIEVFDGEDENQKCYTFSLA